MIALALKPHIRRTLQNIHENIHAHIFLVVLPYHGPGHRYSSVRRDHQDMLMNERKTEVPDFQIAVKLLATAQASSA